MPCLPDELASPARGRPFPRRGRRLPRLALACAASLPACAGGPAPAVATGLALSPASQEPAEAEGRPWMHGFAPATGAGSGKALTLRHESTTVAIDDKDAFVASVDGDVDFDLTGIQYAFAAGANMFRLTVATVGCANEAIAGDSDAGAFGGVAFAFPIARMGRFVWAGDAGFHGGAVDWRQPAYDETSVGWFQYDLRAGLAHAPSPTSRAAVSPRAALGVRMIDGIQDLGAGGTTDFDTLAPYALIGVGGHVRTGARSRLGVDLHGMVGDLQGFEFAISFQF